MKSTEKVTQEKCMSYLKEIGAVAVKVHNGGIYNPTTKMFFKRKKGVADIVFCYNGRFCACEVKSVGKKPTPEQIEFLTSINRAGGVGFWVNDISDLKRVISKIRLTDIVIKKIVL